jgi:hypothetical protein
MCLKTILANHHQNVFKLTKFRKKLFKLMYICGKIIYIIMNVIQNTLRINLKFSISKNINILKLMFVQCLKSSMG